MALQNLRRNAKEALNLANPIDCTSARALTPVGPCILYFCQARPYSEQSSGYCMAFVEPIGRCSGVLFHVRYPCGVND